MKPKERYEWISKYLKENHNESIDILYASFVHKYSEATGAKVSVMPYGADKCPQLGHDLSTMYKLGILKRVRTGLSDGMSCMGFPKWVYTYRLENFTS